MSSHLPYDRALRQVGRDWPTEALTMVGLKRLNNLERCVVRVIQDGVPGDLVETGVWRGGCGILMRAVLAVYQDTERSVWLADSFEGLPVPDTATYPKDHGDEHASLTPYLRIPMETVQENLRHFGLLDAQVRLLKGWFRDTLPTAPIDEIAVLRLDGDMYESTYVALSSLYPKISVGGFLIIDDYGALPNCRSSVEDYRTQHGIAEEIHQVIGQACIGENMIGAAGKTYSLKNLATGLTMRLLRPQIWSTGLCSEKPFGEERLPGK